MGEELNNLTNDVQNLKENERYLTANLNSEKQAVESKAKALLKSENVLKAVIDKNAELKEKNVHLNLKVSNLYILYICYHFSAQ